MNSKTVVLAAILGLSSAQGAVSMGDVSMGSNTIGLACEGSLALEVCDHFETRMAQTYPAYTMSRTADDEVSMTITLLMEPRSERSLTAQLVWDGPNAGEGRAMTSGITGENTNTRQLQFVVDSLIRAVTLPL